MQNLNACGREGGTKQLADPFRLTAQNPIGFLGGVVPSKVVLFYAISAIVAALGLAIFITSATIAYVVAQSFK
jgi:hypothetical protein